MGRLLDRGVSRRTGSAGRSEVAGSRQATDPRLLAFARGLAIGALIGAAIAGSSIWKGRRRDP